MYVLVKNKLTNEYRALKKSDIRDFLSLDNFFKKDPNVKEEDYTFNFEVIEDLGKIKEILNTEFVSRGRSEEYDTNIPSVTQIAYKLKCIDLSEEKFLLRWQNNTKLTEEDEQKSRDICSRGTFEHFILQCYICDQENRRKDKPIIEQLKILKQTKKPSKKIEKQIEDKIIADIKRYIQIAYKDNEIISKIPNLEELKSELEDITLKVLPKFIMKELIFMDLVYSEIFLSVPNFIQGSIDLVCYKDNKFSIVDYKTANSVDKKTGKPKYKTNAQAKHYAYQLAIYNELLNKSGMTHLSENELPDFYIYQIHLIDKDYKKFEISKDTVKHAIKEMKDILNWYWSIRNGTEYIPPQEEELKYLTL
jgi:hypothetical protein